MIGVGLSAIAGTVLLVSLLGGADTGARRDVADNGMKTLFATDASCAAAATACACAALDPALGCGWSSGAGACTTTSTTSCSECPYRPQCEGCQLASDACQCASLAARGCVWHAGDGACRHADDAAAAGAASGCEQCPTMEGCADVPVLCSAAETPCDCGDLADQGCGWSYEHKICTPTALTGSRTSCSECGTMPHCAGEDSCSAYTTACECAQAPNVCGWSSGRGACVETATTGSLTTCGECGEMDRCTVCATATDACACGALRSEGCGWSTDDQTCTPSSVTGSHTSCLECETMDGCPGAPGASGCNLATTPCDCAAAAAGSAETCGWSSRALACLAVPAPEAAAGTGAETTCDECPTMAGCPACHTASDACGCAAVEGCGWSTTTASCRLDARTSCLECATLGGCTEAPAPAPAPAPAEPTGSCVCRDETWGYGECPDFPQFRLESFCTDRTSEAECFAEAGFCKWKLADGFTLTPTNAPTNAPTVSSIQCYYGSATSASEWRDFATKECAGLCYRSTGSRPFLTCTAICNDPTLCCNTDHCNGYDSTWREGRFD